MRSAKRKTAKNAEQPNKRFKTAKHQAGPCAFLCLPTELIHLITANLSQADIHRLCLVDRYVHSLVERCLYTKDALHEYSESLLWSAIHNRPGTARKAISAGAKIDGWKARPHADHRIHWCSKESRINSTYGNRARVPLAHCAQSPLFIAAYQGHLETVQTLLSHGADPGWTTPWENYMTPASAAAAKGHIHVLESMRDSGYDLARDRCYHGTVLHAAVIHGKAKMVEFLVKTVGINIGEKNKDGEAALTASIHSPSVTNLRYLLNLTPAKDASITTAFSEAIGECHARNYAEIILNSNKIDWSGTTKFGDTLISQTIQQNNSQSLHLLLERGGVDPNIPNANGLIPLVQAKQYVGYSGSILKILFNSEKVRLADKLAIGEELFFQVIRRSDCDGLIELLLKEGYAGDDHVAHFHAAARHGRCRIIRLLVEEFAVPVDTRMANGETALKAAFLRRDLDTTQCLCRLGGSTILRGLDHLPMLHLASRYGPVPLMRALLKGGADPNRIAEGSEQTALHFACISGNLDRISVLLKSGADPMIRDSKGFTAYHWAARTGSEKLLKWLLAGRRHPDPLLEDGPTLLHEACRAGNLPVVKLLLKRKCNIEAPTNRGETALHLAVACRHFEIVQLLLGSGADISVKAKDGSTPASLASQKHTEMNKLLQHASGQAKSTLTAGKTKGSDTVRPSGECDRIDGDAGPLKRS